MPSPLCIDIITRDKKDDTAPVFKPTPPNNLTTAIRTLIIVGIVGLIVLILGIIFVIIYIKSSRNDLSAHKISFSAPVVRTLRNPNLNSDDDDDTSNIWD